MRPSLIFSSLREYSDDKERPLATFIRTPFVIDAEVQ
jgi:hypothetical protein